MNHYVSEDFTEEFMDELNNKKIYLIGAECGSGKTTAIMENLVTHAKKENKKVLYLCNRVSLRKQLTNKYKFLEKQEAVVEINKNLTIGMYQKITVSLSYGMEVSDLIEGDYDFVILDEAHLLYDASDYDFKTYLFIKYLNKINNVIIALSGTPNSFLKIGKYLIRNIAVLREVDKTNNSIRKIFLTDEKETFYQTRKGYLKENYKLLELVSNSNSFLEFKKDLECYSVANIMSNSNKKKSMYMNEYDELVLETIIKKEEMICDAVASTKFLDVGVNINAHENFVVTYYCNELPNTIEQFRSRIRFSQNSPYHLDLVFKVMSKKSSLMKIKKIKQYLKRYDELYKLYRDFNTVLENNPKRIFKIGFDIETEDYEQYNAITRAFKEDQLEYYQRIYNAENNLEEYRKIFKEMYPHIEIINIKTLKIKQYLESLLEGQQSILLEPERKENFRKRMKGFKVDKEHPNELPALNRINDYFKKEHIEYSIESKRKTFDYGRHRCWEIIRHVS